MRITNVKIEGTVIWVNALTDKGTRIARGFDQKDKVVQQASKVFRTVLAAEILAELTDD